METKKIDKFIKNCNQVKLYYLDEEISCQILKQSKSLILVKDIKDWHYDAYMIYHKKYIKKIKYGKIEKCRENILPPLKKQDFIKEIDKIDISNIKSALNSLYKLNQGVCIEKVDCNYSFILGVIKKIKDKALIIKGIDLCGQYRKSIKINYDNISSIFYKDEYSTKLINYANSLLS